MKKRIKRRNQHWWDLALTALKMFIKIDNLNSNDGSKTKIFFSQTIQLNQRSRQGYSLRLNWQRLAVQQSKQGNLR